MSNENRNGNRCETRANTSTSRSAASDELEKERLDLEWHSLFNVAIYEDLEHYYGLVDAFFKIAIASYGTSSFLTIFVDFGESYIVYKVCGLLVALLSVVMLVVDYGGLRVQAKNQRIKYSKAYSDAKLASSKRDLDEIRRSIEDIACGDMHSSDICDALAMNATIDRMGRDPTYKVDIGWFKRLTRHILPWGRPKYRNY